MFYRVKAKCGHVGKNHYIEKYFYVVATSGKDAAYKVRYKPRVKHDRKDAILSVEQISQDEFIMGIESNEKDNYFSVRSSSEQRLVGAVDPKDIKVEPKCNNFSKKRNVEYIMKRTKIFEKRYKEMLWESIYG